MGLFSKAKESSGEGTKDISIYEFKKHNNKKNVALFDIEQFGTVNHGDNKTKFIKARLIQYDKETTIMPDTADYICFEIPEDMQLSDLERFNILEALEKKQRMENLEHDRYNHIGRVVRIDDKTFGVKSATDEVELFIRNRMNPTILKNKEAFTQRIASATENTKKDFKTALAEEYKEYSAQMESKQEERKKQIKLEEQFRYKIGEKIYSDYIGVDTQKGKILRINKLDKIGKDQEETYLYSAFIEKVEDNSEEKTMLEGLPQGYPVIFTLKEKMENITNSNDLEQIKTVLDLMSKVPREHLQKEEMTFIGGVDKEGAIYRDIENCSKDIESKVKEKKQEFKQSIKKEELEK